MLLYQARSFGYDESRKICIQGCFNSWNRCMSNPLSCFVASSGVREAVLSGVSKLLNHPKRSAICLRHEIQQKLNGLILTSGITPRLVLPTWPNFWNNPGYVFSYFCRTRNSLPDDIIAIHFVSQFNRQNTPGLKIQWCWKIPSNLRRISTTQAL